MSVQYTLLGFLAEESNYGYELKKKYDGYFGKDKPILTGQIYSTLARLKRDNKVKEIADTSESGRMGRRGRERMRENYDRRVPALIARMAEDIAARYALRVWTTVRSYPGSTRF